MQFPNFSSVIFDMDGLVLDTEPTYQIAWQRALLEMGYDWPNNFFQSLAGWQNKDIERLIMSRSDNDFSIAQFRTLSTKHWHDYVGQYGIAVKQGFFDLVQILQQADINFCLATNSLKNNADFCLRLANIAEVFAIVVTRDQVAQGKPAPDIFLHAAKLLQQPISKCLVIEDSATGIAAAVASEAIPVLIPGSQAKSIDFDGYRYKNLAILADTLKQTL